MSGLGLLSPTSIDAFSSSLLALLREAFERGQAHAAQRESGLGEEAVKGEAQAELFDAPVEQSVERKRNGRRYKSIWTDERLNAAKWLLDSGSNTAAVVSLVNRLPGPKIVSQDVWNMVRRDGCRQPIRRREKRGRAA